MNFSIDKEFKEKIPPMEQDAFDGLRQDILNDGVVRDPLVVWKEENILLDRHHRWAIIQENWETLKDHFSVVYKSLPDRWAAIAWICANQLHKHNMNELQKMKLIQEENDARQKSHGGDRRSEQFSTGENNQLKETQKSKTGIRAVIAKEHDIPESVVRAAVEVGRGIDKGEEAAPGFKEEVLSGKVKATKTALAAIRKMDTEQAKAAVNEIREGVKAKKFPTMRERIDRTDAPAPAISEDKDAVVEFGLDDLLEELDALNADFLRKWGRVLQIHAQLVSEHAAEVATVMNNFLKEFEKMEAF